jgi:hypothetical protein
MRSSSARDRRSPAGTRSFAFMRAASMRCALAAAFLPLVFCTFCGPPPKSAPAPEPSVTLEGDVALAGESPLDRTVVLSDAGGSVCALTSTRFEYELRNLAGHRVRVTGRVAGKTANGPEFLVESYELAPINGRMPVIGTLVARGEGLALVESRSGAEYVLAGRLAEALRAFAGFKVWVDGAATPFEEKGIPGGTISVEGYGIIAAAAKVMPPSDAAPPRP